MKVLPDRLGVMTDRDYRLILWKLPAAHIPARTGDISKLDVDFASAPDLFDTLNEGFTPLSYTLNRLGDEVLLTILLTRPIRVPDTAAAIAPDGH